MSWEAIRLAIVATAPEWIGRVLLAVAVGLVSWFAARWGRSSFERVAVFARADPNARFLVGRSLQGVILAIGLLAVLALLGFDQSVLLATFGTAGLALGLAAQDVLKSFFAGVYLLFERPFLIGDEIEVKDRVGRVEHVGFRATSIRTDDNVLLVVPNSVIFAEIVANRSGRKAHPPAPLQSEGRSPPDPPTGSGAP